jgi:hypothetical protein
MCRTMASGPVAAGYDTFQTLTVTVEAPAVFVGFSY